jgi:hypothetical protein
MNNATTYSTNPNDKSLEQEVLSDVIVSILCSVIGFLPDETDSTTLLRLFMVLGRIFLPSKSNHSCNTGVVSGSVRDDGSPRAVHCAAITLAKDLGIVDILTNACALVDDGGGGNKDSETCRKVIPELISLLTKI